VAVGVTPSVAPAPPLLAPEAVTDDPGPSLLVPLALHAAQHAAIASVESVTPEDQTRWLMSPITARVHKTAQAMDRICHVRLFLFQPPSVASAGAQRGILVHFISQPGNR
jgi:hypothetical protein